MKSIQVTLKFTVFLKDELGRSIPDKVTIPEGSSIQDLIEEIDRISGGKFKRRFDRGDIVVLLNGRGVLKSRMSVTKIEDGDEIIFMPLVGAVG